MSEPNPNSLYYANITPTEAELKLLARLREISGLCVVDSENMMLWACHRPEPCNGRRRSVIERRSELPFLLPIDP